MTAYVLKDTAVIDMEFLGNLSDSITVFGLKGQCFLFSFYSPAFVLKCSSIYCRLRRIRRWPELYDGIKPCRIIR